jgi:hypothetical protein
MIKNLCMSFLLTFITTTLSIQASELTDDLIASSCHKNHNVHHDCKKRCQLRLEPPLFGLFGIIGETPFTLVPPGAKIPLNNTFQADGFVLLDNGAIQLVDAKRDQTYLFRIEFVASASAPPRFNIQVGDFILELQPLILPVPASSSNETLFYCTQSYETVLSQNSVISLSNSAFGVPFTLVGAQGSILAPSITLQVTQIPDNIKCSKRGPCQ